MPAPAYKRCTKCGGTKSLDDFHRDRRTTDGRKSHCAECHKADALERYRRERAANPERLNGLSRSWREKNREKSRESVRRAQIKASFGITLEEYRELMQRPCAICGANSEALDHDHTTGRLREPLCDSCNTSLGRMKDDPQRLRRAADYVERHQQNGRSGI